MTAWWSALTALLLAVAVPARAQVGPEDALADAQARLARQDWRGAADRAALVLADPARSGDHAVAWRILGGALEIEDYRYGALVSYAKAIELSPAAAAPAYDAILRLTDALDEDRWIGGLIGRDLGVEMTPDARARVAVVAARHHASLDAWGPALAVLPLVPDDHPKRLEALVLEGVALAQQGRYVDAIVPLATAYELGRASGRSSHDLSVLALDTARAFYAAGNYGQAMAYDDRVPRTDPLWPYALFERAWAHFAVDDIPGTIALLETHKSPFFDDLYLPEADLLRAQSLYLMCKFPETTKAVDAFEAKYAPIRDALQSGVGALDPAGALAAVRPIARGGRPLGVPAPVVQRLRTDARFLDAVAALDQGLTELAALERGDAAWVAPVTTALKARLTVREVVEGARVLTLLRTERDALVDMLQGLELTRIELLQLQSRLYDQAAATGTAVEEMGQDRFRDLRRRNKRVWPFEGEYWADELGHYRVLARPDCPSALQRGG